MPDDIARLHARMDMLERQVAELHRDSGCDSAGRSGSPRSRRPAGLRCRGNDGGPRSTNTQQPTDAGLQGNCSARPVLYRNPFLVTTLSGLGFPSGAPGLQSTTSSRSSRPSTSAYRSATRAWRMARSCARNRSRPRWGHHDCAAAWDRPACRRGEWRAFRQARRRDLGANARAHRSRSLHRQSLVRQTGPRDRSGSSSGRRRGCAHQRPGQFARPARGCRQQSRNRGADAARGRSCAPCRRRHFCRRGCRLA